MKIKNIFFYVIPFLLGGCIPIMSLNPFFTDSDIVFEQKLIGTWVDDVNEPDTTWIFLRNEDEPNNAYQLTFIDQKGNKGTYIAILMKLDDKLFLDVYPDKMPWDIEDSNNVKFLYNTFFLIPSHTILKVDAIEPQLLFNLTQTSKFEELLNEHPDEIEFKKIEDTIVLTSSTKKLQSFILKYNEDERMFPEKIKLIRKEE